MTNIEPLSLDVDPMGQLIYGDGIVRLYYPAPPTPLAAGYIWIPILAIDVPPAPPGTFEPGSDDGGGFKPFWPMGCGIINCCTCTKTPCIVPTSIPRMPTSPPDGFGPMLAIQTSAGGVPSNAPLLIITNAATLGDVCRQVEAWVAGVNASIHVYSLDLRGLSPDVAATLGPYVALAVSADLAEEKTSALEPFFTVT
jgi:hypothetical protein